MQDASDLRLFSKSQQVGQNIEMLETPIATSHSHAALHLIENQEEVVFVANLSELLQPFAAKMIVAALALDRFDDDRANVCVVLLNEIVDLALGFLFALDHIRFTLRFQQ